MVVCICNALNEATIHEALKRCCKVKDVHSACDCEVQCGSCLEYIATMKEGYSNGQEGCLESN